MNKPFGTDFKGTLSGVDAHGQPFTVELKSAQTVNLKGANRDGIEVKLNIIQNADEVRAKLRKAVPK